MGVGDYDEVVVIFNVIKEDGIEEMWVSCEVWFYFK